MEIAKLVLEYIKVLAWPLTTFILVIKFREAISRILFALGDRLSSAENVNLGVLGVEMELSGTARELQAEQQQLLIDLKTDPKARKRIGQVSGAIQELNNPIADMVGLALFESPNSELRFDDLIHQVVIKVGGEKSLEGPQAQILFSAMSREIRKITNQLENLEFIVINNEMFKLSRRGYNFFKRVSVSQRNFLDKYAPRESQSKDIN